MHRILLINPWVYDFAAYNLWARPLGLLKVADFLSQYDIDIRLIDCMEDYKPRKYYTGKYSRVSVEKPFILKDIPRQYSRYGMDLESFKENLKQTLPCDAIFITSLMTYWYPGVEKVVEVIREISKDIFIILGGIYATLYPEHAKRVIKPGGLHTGSINDEWSKTTHLHGLKKIREKVPFYRSGLYKSMPFAPLYTSSGCPFTCTYCASPFLNKKFSQRPHDDVVKEILELNDMGVKDFAFYDDALLINSERHIKPLLKEVIKLGLKVRFHCPNGIHAKYVDDELAYLMKKATFKTIRIGLETVDKIRQKQSGGKVNISEFLNAVGSLKKHGFTKSEIGVYLIYGLYGQELSEVTDSIKFLMSQDVTINLTEFSPIPHTDSFNELVAKKIITADIDPLVTNNTVFSYLYGGYDNNEIEKLKLKVKRYNRGN